MAGTVVAAFEELLSRIELNPSRVALASQRYNAVKEVLERAGHSLRRIGSCQRSTKIRPLDLSDALDVDAVATRATAHRIAPAGEPGGITPGRALEDLRNALCANQTYKVMEPQTDAPTVVLQYADNFSIEVVPAFIDKTGKHEHGPGQPDCYLIPKHGDWVPADYDFDAGYISDLNNSVSIHGTLVPAIKMIKAFVRGQDIRLTSFQTECLVARIVPPAIRQWSTQSLIWGYRHVLAHFLSQVSSVLTEPIGIPGSFTPLSQLSPIQFAVFSASLTAKGARAWEICKIENEPQAIRAWYEFFGAPFPSS